MMGAAALIPAACGDAPESAEVLRPVRTLQVFAAGSERVRSFTGTARSSAETRLSFRVPGTIIELPIVVGDSVAQGDLIARLDAEDFRLQLREAEAGLAQASAQAQNAQSSYSRTRDLYESGNASRADLDAALAASQSTEATVRAANQRVQLARQQLGYAVLRAPTAGATAAVFVEVNENVQAGQPIVLLASGSGIEVVIAAPEVLIARISEGDSATVEFDAIPDRRFAARVSEVGVATVGTATTYPVSLILEQAPEEVRSGMAAVASLTFTSEQSGGAFLVPSVAVGEDRDGRYVYVAQNAGDGSGAAVVRRRAVTVGELTAEGLEVLDGLNDGDQVVVAGVSRLSDGLRVRADRGE
jgi:RND family efflux transporter MFP subunit